jgi:hypothetical protein
VADRRGYDIADGTLAPHSWGLMAQRITVGVIAMEGFFFAVMLLSQIIGATVLFLAPIAGVIFFAWYVGRILERPQASRSRR